MSIKKLSIITLEQCKASRDLLNWSQTDLKQHSGLGKTTIADFERGKGSHTDRTLKDIRRTFENNGIEFINDDDWQGVKLAKK